MMGMVGKFVVIFDVDVNFGVDVISGVDVFILVVVVGVDNSKGKSVTKVIGLTIDFCFFVAM